MPITQRRLEKFRRVAARRQPDLTVVLENVHDPHNIGAVLRSADSVGVGEIFVLHTQGGAIRRNLKLGKRTSAGARRWVDVHYYVDVEACFAHVRRRYDRVLATHLDEEARTLHQLDLTGPVALLFGNEHAGLSREALAHSDGNFIIPQVGMVESLNISVACAVSLYEAYRQRQAKGYYDDNLPQTEEQQEQRLEEYLHRHREKLRIKSVPPLHRDKDLP